jgi:excisionase family DNA binding protein
MEKLLRTNEVAKLCQVSQGTVIRWIKEGKIPAASTGGGHNRVALGDVIDFLKIHHLPLPDDVSIEKKRILIVDDEPGLRDMIRFMLEREFPSVLIEEAAEGFSAGWKTHSFNPDLVILDLMIPGLDGLQVCDFIRQLEVKRTKIIAISAINDPEVRNDFLKSGANEFLPKPFELDSLKEMIAALLNERNSVKSHV